MTKTEKLNRLYEECNQLYFNGKLPYCRCTYTNMESYGDYMNYKSKNGIQTTLIRISNKVEWNDISLRQILVHEMIHHYVYTIDGFKGGWDGFCLRGVFKHGTRFQRVAKRIKKETGFKVPIWMPTNWKKKDEVLPTTLYGKFIRFLNHYIG